MSLREPVRVVMRHGRMATRWTMILLVVSLAARASTSPLCAADAPVPATAPAADADTPAAAAPATPATASETLLEAISATARLVVTVSGRYEQRTLNAGDIRPEVRLGRFAIQAPDHYNLVETRPDDPDWKKRQCSDGHTQWEIEQVFPDVKPAITTHSDGAADGDLRRVMACVRGDLSGLASDFSITATATHMTQSAAGAAPIAPSPATGDGARLVLLPRSAEIARDVSRVVILLDADSHVRTLTIEQPSGTRITLTITAAVYNQPVPDQDFRYVSP